MKTHAKLTQTQNDREITPKEDARFIQALQQSVLLALTESGVLTETQFGYASERLKEQYLLAVRKQTPEGGG